MKNVFFLLGWVAITLTAGAQSFETGVITVNQRAPFSWHTVPLQETYVDPIIIVGPPSTFDPEALAGARVRPLGTTGFEVRLDEWDYADQNHGEETMGYLVIDRGGYATGGTYYEAGKGTVSLNPSAPDPWQTIAFDNSFSSTPVVLVQLASEFDGSAVALRIRNVTTEGFEIRMQHEQGRDGVSHLNENFHYFALLPGNGNTLGQAYQAGIISSPIDHNFTTFNFNARTHPILFASMQTADDEDPATLRYDNLTGGNVAVAVQEEKSDDEVSHGEEQLGVLIINSPVPERRLLWYESFSLPNHTTDDNGTTAWSLANRENLGTDGNNIFQVKEEELVAKNTDTEVAWVSEAILIAGYHDVKIALDIGQVGNFGFENEDYLQVYYQLDNGPETPLLNGLWQSTINKSIATIGGLTGSELRIIAKFKNSAEHESYTIDNVRVFTESSERYAIQNGNWNDPDTWSYTPGGPSCSCLPDPLSNTHIDGYTVTMATQGHTRNLTVYNSSRLDLTVDDQNLMLYGNATLDVKNGGGIVASAKASVTFAHWNSRDKDLDNERFGANYLGVRAVINVDDPAGLQIHELSLDAAGEYIFQGSGNIDLLDDLDINNEAAVTNNLEGTFNVTDKVFLDYANIVFTNNKHIMVGGNLRYRRANIHLVNNGNFDTYELNTSADNSRLTTTSGSTFRVNNITDLANNELTIHNYGTIDMIGNIVSVEPNKGLFHNHTGGVWHLGGKVIDDNIYWFAHEPDNEIHYNGTQYQKLISPRDINAPSQTGPYWHLTVSNRHTNTASPNTSYKKISADLDINGNFTIVGTPAGRVSVALNKNLSVAGNYKRQSVDYAFFGEGLSNEVVTFDGPTDQRIFSQEIFRNLAIDKSSGKVDVADEVQIEKEAHFRNGIVGTSSSPLVFKSTARVATASDNSHVQGKVSKIFAFNELASSTTYTIDIYAAGQTNSETMLLIIDDEIKATWTNVGGDPNNDVFSQYTYTTDIPFGSIEVGFIEDEGFRDLRIDRIVINGVSFEAEDAEATDHLRDGACNTLRDEWLYCDGVFRWNFTLREEITAFSFPLGDGVSYRPLGLSQVSESAHFTAEYLNAPAPDADAKPDSMLNLAPCGYWSVNQDPNQGEATAHLTLSWDQASCPVNPNELVIARWNGTQWTALPGTIAGDAASGSITSAVPVADFGTLAAPALFTLAELSDLPRTRDDEITTQEDVTAQADVLANDTDDNGIDTTSVVIVRDAQHGTVTLDPTTGQITYTPEGNFFGPDSLTYTVRDRRGLTSRPTTLVITVAPVNDAPVALDDQATTPFRTLLNSPSVLLNDRDPVEGDALTAMLLAQTTQGALTFYPDGSYSYAPSSSFYGTDSFTYQVCDSGTPTACDTATVTITVRSPETINRAPRAQDDSFTTQEDTSLTANVLDNDVDPDGDFLTVILTPVVAPQQGSVVFSDNGTLVYTPVPDFFGTDQFTYRVCDNADACDTATVTIIVSPVNDPPVAVNDTLTVTEAASVSGNLLANDYDVDQDTLTASLLLEPSFGQVSLQADGSFTYTPDDTFTGQDRFTYQACDSGTPTLCHQATVLITVSPLRVLQVPKGFSPNGDATNDTWIIAGIRAYPNNTVTIFNRWGNIVYRVQGYDNLNTVWRGQARQGITPVGTSLPDGTYFYVINLNHPDSTQPLNGYIILKR